MHYKTKYQLLISFFIFFLGTTTTHGQISYKGEPRFYIDASRNDKQVIVPTPNLTEIYKEDSISDMDDQPRRNGVIIPKNINIIEEASVTQLPDGKLYRLNIYSQKAKGLALYFNDFYIPDGGELFVYNPQKDIIYGAFNEKNNTSSGIFGIQPMYGDQLIVEYFQPNEQKEEPSLVLDKVLFLYRDMPEPVRTTKDFDDSGSCEVNIACDEGLPYFEQGLGVVRILLVQQFDSYWCTGSLINNTRNDRTPYILTANHCGINSSMEEYNLWMFYFRYQSDQCTTNTRPVEKTMTGAELIAYSSANGETGEAPVGSDFKLIKLAGDIPESYMPVFNGWNRNGQASNVGATIHHPAGDTKKISFYTSSLISSDYEDLNSSNPNADFWRVYWSATKNGHGATEGGSSGAPIFNNEKLIVGTLTGGYSSCSSPNSPDYYGKFSSHWDKNGSANNLRLDKWLDPDNVGVLRFPALGLPPGPDFTANSYDVLLNSRIQFENISSGQDELSNYRWTFEGGSPSSYNSNIANNPPVVQYKQAGKFKVSLTVTLNGEDVTKEKDIIVTPDYISEGNGKYKIVFGNMIPEDLDIVLISVDGKKETLKYNQSGNNSIDINIYNKAAGVYLLQPRGIENSGIKILHIK
ncbi:MAG: trypsin-like serine protease [Hyphomicrobiales bacterium]